MKRKIIDFEEFVKAYFPSYQPHNFVGPTARYNPRGIDYVGKYTASLFSLSIALIEGKTILYATNDKQTRIAEDLKERYKLDVECTPVDGGFSLKLKK